MAIKIVRRFIEKACLGKQESSENKVKKEVAELKKPRHPHVMSLLEGSNGPEFGKTYLILMYIELGMIIWRTRADENIAVSSGISGNTVVAMEEEKIEGFNQDREARRAKKSSRSREGHLRADQQTRASMV